MTTNPPTSARANGANGNDRTATGQFAKGHSIPGPGNPHLQRIRQYNDAIQKAVNAEDLGRLMRKLLLRAHRGDMAAAKLVLDRTMGKANSAPIVVEAADLGIEALATTQDVKAASESILRAMAQGRISVDDGAKFAGVVELVRKAIETHELEERIAQLEGKTL